MQAGWRTRGFRLRAFKTKPFARFARREGIPDAALCDAVRRAGWGQVDADLGGGVINVYGFAKSGRDNLRQDEFTAFRLLAEQMLGMDEAGLRAALSNGTITEVVCDEQAV